MMLILSVILMCPYLYPVCLVSQVLKNTDFKEHLSVVALCSMFKHSPNGKVMVYGPNGKGIMASMEYILIIYSPNGKGMDSWNTVLPSCNRQGKRLK